MPEIIFPKLNDYVCPVSLFKAVKPLSDFGKPPSFLAKMVKFVFRPTWVKYKVYDDEAVPELGLMLSFFGHWHFIVGFYKGCIHWPTQIETVDLPEKREFGESLEQKRLISRR